jgi:hypothetical protein
VLLFLDFDGVLHPASTTDPAHLLCRRPLLEAVLRQVPAVDVVVSSTWRHTRTLAQLRGLFSDDFARRIIGCTPQWDTVAVPAPLAAYPRQAEIHAWLHANGRAWEAWVALDDQPWLFRPFLPNLVKVDHRTGLTEALCGQLYDRLATG